MKGALKLLLEDYEKKLSGFGTDTDSWQKAYDLGKKTIEDLKRDFGTLDLDIPCGFSVDTRDGIVLYKVQVQLSDNNYTLIFKDCTSKAGVSETSSDITIGIEKLQASFKKSSYPYIKLGSIATLKMNNEEGYSSCMQALQRFYDLSMAIAECIIQISHAAYRIGEVQNSVEDLVKTLKVLENNDNPKVGMLYTECCYMLSALRRQQAEDALKQDDKSNAEMHFKKSEKFIGLALQSSAYADCSVRSRVTSKKYAKAMAEDSENLGIEITEDSMKETDQKMKFLACKVRFNAGRFYDAKNLMYIANNDAKKARLSCENAIQHLKDSVTIAKKHKSVRLSHKCGTLVASEDANTESGYVTVGSITIDMNNSDDSALDNIARCYLAMSVLHARNSHLAQSMYQDQASCLQNAYSDLQTAKNIVHLLPAEKRLELERKIHEAEQKIGECARLEVFEYRGNVGEITAPSPCRQSSPSASKGQGGDCTSLQPTPAVEHVEYNTVVMTSTQKLVVRKNKTLLRQNGVDLTNIGSSSPTLVESISEGDQKYQEKYKELELKIDAMSAELELALNDILAESVVSPTNQLDNSSASKLAETTEVQLM